MILKEESSRVLVWGWFQRLEGSDKLYFFVLLYIFFVLCLTIFLLRVQVQVHGITFCCVVPSLYWPHLLQYPCLGQCGHPLSRSQSIQSYIPGAVSAPWFPNNTRLLIIDVFIPKESRYNSWYIPLLFQSKPLHDVT